MNKLEALNSPKYSLTPEKMGELVGGDIRTECTDIKPGFNLRYYKGNKISADYTIRYSGSVFHNGIEQDTFVYWGDGDTTLRNEEHGCCR